MLNKLKKKLMSKQKNKMFQNKILAINKTIENMFSSIIYVLATLSLTIGSVLTFNSNLPDYFFLAGTSLFFLNSIIKLVDNIIEYRKRYLYAPVFDL